MQDENIVLTFAEAHPVVSDYLTNKFEEIPDTSSVIVVKINNIDPSNIEIDEDLILNYIKDLDVTVIYSSAGMHLNGKRKIPHVHWHFITTPLKSDTKYTSQHRQRWCSKNGLSKDAFKNISMSFHMFIDTTKPKYSTLSYPLKEGISIPPFVMKRAYMVGEKKMGPQMLDYLLSVGKQIYDKELADNLRRDKCEERKKETFEYIWDLVKEQKFDSYKELCVWLEINYIRELPYNKKPVLSNYKNIVMACALNLELIKYSDYL